MEAVRFIPLFLWKQNQYQFKLQTGFAKSNTA